MFSGDAAIGGTTESPANVAQRVAEIKHQWRSSTQSLYETDTKLGSHQIGNDDTIRDVLVPAWVGCTR